MPALGLRGLNLEACWGLVPLPDLGGRLEDIPDFLQVNAHIDLLLTNEAFVVML